MDKNKRLTKKKQKEKITPEDYLQHINPYAAGIDVGSKSHFVAVRTPNGEISIKEFATFTPDLYLLAQWLKENQVTTVAMECRVTDPSYPGSVLQERTVRVSPQPAHAFLRPMLIDPAFLSFIQ